MAWLDVSISDKELLQSRQSLPIEKNTFKYQYVSTADRFIQKIGFSELENYFYDIINVHCYDLNNGYEKHQYSTQNIIVDITDYCSNSKVLKVKNSKDMKSFRH